MKLFTGLNDKNKKTLYAINSLNEKVNQIIS